MNDSSSSSSKSAATLIVVAKGTLEKPVARLATERAAYDPDGRRVLSPGDVLYPSPISLKPWMSHDVAALVLNASGCVCAVLDSRQAMAAGWIEDAFLRAKRVGELLQMPAESIGHDH
jgi:hypothetical protein